MSLQHIGRILNELGWTDTIVYLLARALTLLTAGRGRIIRYHLVAQPIPQTSLAASRPSPKCHIRRVAAQDPVVAIFPRPPEVIAKRFADGATCFVAQNGGRFSGFIWIARNAYEEDEVRCRYELDPPERCAWDYDVYVEPDFRIGRTFSRLWDAVNSHLRAEGVHWSISRISAFNPSSLAAHRRLGIKRITTATFVLIGPLQASFLGQPPYLHLSRGKHNRPILQLTPSERDQAVAGTKPQNP